MQQLLDAVKQVKHTIQKHNNVLRKSETLTRYALIDVVLNGLGWDVHDPDKVFPEYSDGLNLGKADYALLDIAGKPIAFVEAKKLGELKTPDSLMQVTNYAFHIGVQYSLTTDGNIWVIADAFKRVPLPDKELMRFSITSEPEKILIEKLSYLLPDNLYKGDQAFFPPLEKPVTNSVPTFTPIPALVAPLPASSLPRSTTGRNRISLSKVIVTNAKEKPNRLVFSDGTEVIIDSYAQVPKRVAEWLIQKGKLPSPPIEDCFHRNPYLINIHKLHKNGAPFHGNPYQLSNGYWLNTDYKADACIKNAVWLLRKAGENPDNCFFQ